MMADGHNPTDNVIYDLVSIEYHALKGGQVCQRYAQDVDGHPEVREFLEQICREDKQRAMRAHELIAKLSA